MRASACRGRFAPVWTHQQHPHTKAARVAGHALRPASRPVAPAPASDGQAPVLLLGAAATPVQAAAPMSEPSTLALAMHAGKVPSPGPATPPPRAPPTAPQTFRRWGAPARSQSLRRTTHIQGHRQQQALLATSAVLTHIQRGASSSCAPRPSRPPPQPQPFATPALPRRASGLRHKGSWGLSC